MNRDKSVNFYTLTVQILGTGALFKFKVVRVRGTGAFSLDCCAAGADADAVFYDLFLWDRGAGTVFFKIFECRCKTAPTPARVFSFNSVLK